MSKRFIDTEIFNDSWFMELSPNAKLLFIYLFTQCNHAGIIDFNIRLAEYQTGIKQLSKSIGSLTKELGNRIYNIRDNYYYLTKYVNYQYPGFPKSKVRQQDSALNILIKFGLYNVKTNTFIKELNNSYDNVSDSGNDSVIDNGNEDINIIEIEFEDFWNEYGVKIGDKGTAKEYWNGKKKLKDNSIINNLDRNNIINCISDIKEFYKQKDWSLPNPTTLLYQRRWENEFQLENKGLGNYGK